MGFRLWSPSLAEASHALGGEPRIERAGETSPNGQGVEWRERYFQKDGAPPCGGMAGAITNPGWTPG
jgi:hypothetical protein